MPTSEYWELRNDPDLQAEPGPGGVLVIVDGDGFCVIGPEYGGPDDTGNIEHGASREEALANYQMTRPD